MSCSEVIRALAIPLWVMLACSASLWASDPQNALTKCGEGTVASVEAGDRFRLENGIVITLDGVMAPVFYQAESSYKSWPHATRSKAILEELINGKAIDLFCPNGRRAQDHLNRLPRQVYLKREGYWLQETLLKVGAVFTYGGDLDPTLHQHLFQLETAARNQKKGLWKSEPYNPVSANSDHWKTGWFQFVRGKVKSVNFVRDTLYLNFGEDWRTDFTVQLSKNIAETYTKEDGINLTALEGKYIEVRGFLEWSSGPKIIVIHRNQIALTNGQGDKANE